MVVVVGIEIHRHPYDDLDMCIGFRDFSLGNSENLVEREREGVILSLDC